MSANPEDESTEAKILVLMSRPVRQS